MKYLINLFWIFISCFFCLLPASNQTTFAINTNTLQENIESTKQTDTVPSRNYTVVIDPGHGGTDPGSIGYKTNVHEADLNLKLSLIKLLYC